VLRKSKRQYYGYYRVKISMIFHESKRYQIRKLSSIRTDSSLPLIEGLKIQDKDPVAKELEIAKKIIGRLTME